MQMQSIRRPPWDTVMTHDNLYIDRLVFDDTVRTVI